MASLAGICFYLSGGRRLLRSEGLIRVDPEMFMHQENAPLSYSSWESQVETSVDQMLLEAVAQSIMSIGSHHRIVTLRKAIR